MTLPSTEFILPGYIQVEQLYSNSRIAVYRAIEELSQHRVILKCLQDSSSFTDVLQFRNQYTIAKNLDFPRIVRPLRLETWENYSVLVMADSESIALSQYKQDYPLDLVEILAIALQLAEILHELSRCRVIHKDIKPANILIHPISKQIQLIDFSLASLLPRETQEIQSPAGLEGTLTYLAPEQTGRMNRGIDYRSDFYALGVTIYELLTGQLPFQSDDAMELVHCHLAKTAIAPHLINPDIPESISEIVLKLMAKNAEDRYQSALGLKYDLEQCLYQLKNIGTIQHFDLASRDLSDRFLIPEKLYGREIEVNELLAAFDRVTQNRSELMLVAGFSGIGKTAVVNEVHKPIVRQRGYFIKGKFDQFQRNIPFSAFLQAFRDLMGQLLSESDTQLAIWKSKILQAVGENGQVIIDVIPELERIIEQQPPILGLSGSAAQNRFNSVFQKFIQVFTTPDHPLVIFLDDLQWADPASLNLLKLLMTQAESQHLLILGAYRDNEVSPAHPLMLTLEEIQKAESVTNTITLNPLSETTINQLVADTLSCQPELAYPLTQLTYQKTKGNPFFTTQFLKALHEEGWIQFDLNLGYWQCDLTAIRQVALTDDVVEFMAVQLQKLPKATQHILQFAACIGNQFDLNTLAIVSQRSPIETATALWKALQEGLILPIHETYKFFQSHDSADLDTDVTVNYKFLHDRVQQAAYSLIVEDQQQLTHLKIGQLLQKNLSESEQEERLFDIVGHLNLGQSLLTTQSDREALARLNLAAAQKAQNSTAYAAARSFVQSGLDLLDEACWKTQYDLTLKLFITAVELAYLNGHFAEMEDLAAQVLHSAETILDKVKVYEIQISAQTAQGHMIAAIAIGHSILTQLGIEFSAEQDDTLTHKVLHLVAEQLQDQQIEELINLPRMSNPEIRAGMRILAILFAPIFHARPTLLPLLGATMVNLSLQFGNTPASTIGYVSYGTVLAAFLDRVEEGYCFGRLALNLLNQWNVQEFKCKTFILFTFFLQHRKESRKAALPFMKEGYLAGMETGDFLYAGYNIVNYFFNQLASGISFEEWEPDMLPYCAGLAAVKQESPLAYMRMSQQIVQNFREFSNSPDVLQGLAYDEAIMIPQYRQNSEFNALAVVHVWKMILAYTFGNYAQALDYLAEVNQNAMAIRGTISVPLIHFYSVLVDLALWSTFSESEQSEAIARIKANQTALSSWAQDAPMNYQHNVDLVKAEKCRVFGKEEEAKDWYDRAIAGAQAQHNSHETALAHELAAKFYLNSRNEKTASHYMQQAREYYKQWGATAKVTHLETLYPKLFVATSPEQKISLTQSTTRPNSWLDLPAVMKAAQAISQEIELENLLATLMQIAIANAGAQTGILAIHQSGEWIVVAKADQDYTSTFSTPLSEFDDLPKNLIYSVARNQTTEVFDDLSTAEQFTSDRYLSTYHPKSALCTPMIQQGKLIGILYLENNLTVGAFTSDRVETLQLLMTQAAISIENARLYQQMENYSQTLEAEVARKTEALSQKATDLEQTLQNLQQTQAQLVQSEKMSALGQLVAGIAHEINNPVTFIHGNLAHTEEYCNDLLDLLKLYQSEYPKQTSAIQNKIEEIDLEFLEEDLIKTLGSMSAGSDRIRKIILSLRNFSRLDEADMKAVDLHEGIESTLLILQNRFQDTVEIIKDFGNLPQVTCYASEMNQVFLNVLSNALDALQDSDQDRRIRIETNVVEESVRIAIADNGIGIAIDIQQRIFDPFFTTKPVGSGVGLGLSVSYTIIKKHGGTLTCDSTLGRGTTFLIEIPIQPL